MMLVFFKMRQSTSGNNATHAVAHQVDDHILLLVLFHVVSYIFFDLFCQIFAHLFDIPISIVLVTS